MVGRLKRLQRLKIGDTKDKEVNTGEHEMATVDTIKSWKEYEECYCKEEYRNRYCCTNN